MTRLLLIVSSLLTGPWILLVSAEEPTPPLPKVVGIVSDYGDSKNSQVILESPTNGEQELFAPGTKAFEEYLIQEITKEHVIIAFHSDLFRLPIAGGSTEKMTGANDSSPKKPAGNTTKQGTGPKVKIMYLPGSRSPDEIRKLVNQGGSLKDADNVIVKNNYESFLKGSFLKDATNAPKDLVGPSRAFSPIQDLQGTILGLRISDSEAAGFLSAFGFRDGDILLEVNLHPVHSYQSLCAALQDTSQGRVLFDYLRDNRRLSYAVTPY